MNTRRFFIKKICSVCLPSGLEKILKGSDGNTILSRMSCQNFLLSSPGSVVASVYLVLSHPLYRRNNTTFITPMRVLSPTLLLLMLSGISSSSCDVTNNNTATTHVLQRTTNSKLMRRFCNRKVMSYCEQ